MPQYWGVSANGGYLANPRLSKQIRHANQPLQRARQFSRAEPGFGKNKSDRILFDKVSNVTTGGGQITELSKMPEDEVSIGQGSVIVAEWGNSIPYTGKLEALSEFDVKNVVQKALMNDEKKVLDGAVVDEFQTSMVKATPTGTAGSPTTTFDEDGTISNAATRDCQTYDVKECVDRLESTYYAERYEGGDDFMCLGSVGFLRTIHDDTDFEEAAKYGDPERLFSGEVGRYYGCRFVKQVNGMASVLGTTTYKGEFLMFGDDPIVEGMALPEELRSKLPLDYGRDKGVAWYGLMNWSLTYDSATAGENRLIHGTST